LIDCNYDILKNSSESSAKLWLITESIEGMSLDTYVSTYVPKFRQIMDITLSLIDLIKQIHQQNIVHRNVIPKNVLIRHSASIDGEQIHLGLIDFDLAHIDQKNINQNNQNVFTRVDNPLENDFYLIPQFEVEPLNNNDIDDENQPIKSERQSKTIDASYICAILFWMITLHKPKVSRNIDGKAPHEVMEDSRSIDYELNKLAGKKVFLLLIIIIGYF
jgi:serine/threonine protein kinase